MLRFESKSLVLAVDEEIVFDCISSLSDDTFGYSEDVNALLGETDAFDGSLFDNLVEALL